LAKEFNKGVKMAIIDYSSYKGLLISRDTNVADGEQVYIGNGQGCNTFWFKSVSEAKNFIDYYCSEFGVLDLIPRELCEDCRGHYSYQSAEWKRATRENCHDFKEALKRAVKASPTRKGG
jgi:hypothetical protein